MQLNSFTRNIEDILALKRTYIIPRFQREYSWGEEELSVLWNDIIDNIRVETDKLKTQDYFFGSLVLVGNETKDKRFLVVDGQQRLTTVTILFSAIAKIFKSLGEQKLMKGTHSYVIGTDNNDEEYYILENESPKPYFQFMIQKLQNNMKLLPQSEEETKLEHAYNFFIQKLEYSKLKKEFKNENFQYVDLLKGIRDQVLKFITIYITVDDIDDAYLIFETLNAKGKDLEPIDLVKNKIFYILNKETPMDDTKEKWKLIKSSLHYRENKVSIGTFFRHFWLSKYAFTTEGKLYESFIKKIEPSKEKYNILLDEMVRAADIYAQIINPLESDWRQVEEKFTIGSLSAITLFNVSQVNTLLLSLIRLRKDNKISLKYFKKAIKTLENFHFIFTAICSSRASGLESKYSKYSRQLNESITKDQAQKIIDCLIEELKNKLPSKTMFIEKFSNLRYTKENTADKKLIQYIMKTMEEYFQGTDELKVNIISIEHVMSESTKKNEVGFIGNLLPLDKKINSDIGDDIYVNKVNEYKKSSLVTVEHFINDYGNLTDWTKENIINRTNLLAEKAFDEVWKI